MKRIPLGVGRYLPVYRTYALGLREVRVERAVVVVHGTDRNADGYFATMVATLQAAGTLPSTLVVSPRFQALEDVPRPDEPYWSTEGCKRGDLSASDSPLARISSLAAVDTLLRLLADPSRFPALKSIVITGHSACAVRGYCYRACFGGVRCILKSHGIQNSGDAVAAA